MTIVATVKSGTKGVLENDARVSSDAVDPNNANDSATTFTNVTLSANLALTFTADSPTAKPSTTIHYKVTVNNLGPSDADGVVVTVNLPPAKSGYYVKDDGGCTLSNVTLTCPLGTFVAGSPTRTILIDWFVQGSKFPIVASASVASLLPTPSRRTTAPTSRSESNEQRVRRPPRESCGGRREHSQHELKTQTDRRGVPGRDPPPLCARGCRSGTDRDSSPEDLRFPRPSATRPARSSSAAPASATRSPADALPFPSPAAGSAAFAPTSTDDSQSHSAHSPVQAHTPSSPNNAPAPPDPPCT